MLAPIERVDAVLLVDPDGGDIGVEFAPRRQLRPEIHDLVTMFARAENHRDHACPLFEASKVAGGLRSNICSICSSVTPAARRAGRMSSEMWV